MAMVTKTSFLRQGVFKARPLRRWIWYTMAAVIAVALSAGNLAPPSVWTDSVCLDLYDKQWRTGQYYPPRWEYGRPRCGRPP